MGLRAEYDSVKTGENSFMFKVTAHLRDIIYQIYSERTGQPLKKIAADSERNKWFDAKEMVAYGLADKVLEHPPRPLGPKKDTE